MALPLAGLVVGSFKTTAVYAVFHYILNNLGKITKVVLMSAGYGTVAWLGVSWLQQQMFETVVDLLGNLGAYVEHFYYRFGLFEVFNAVMSCVSIALAYRLYCAQADSLKTKYNVKEAPGCD